MLDDHLPRYDFSERHQRRIDVSPEIVWSALAALTMDDLTVTRPLVALRNGHRSAPARGPLLENGPVALLHREDGRLALAGAVAQPWRRGAPRRPVSSVDEFVAFGEPGWTKYLTEFRIEPGPAAGSCTLITETRGVSTDRRARHRFALYWALIRIPSGVVRRDILRSVARSARIRASCAKKTV